MAANKPTTATATPTSTNVTPRRLLNDLLYMETPVFGDALTPCDKQANAASDLDQQDLCMDRASQTGRGPAYHPYALTRVCART
jgi:hypothetical protein